MGEIEIMLYKDTFLELAAKEGFAMDVIGYDYLEQLHRYIPIFKLPENERDIPTNGGAIYYDEDLKKWGFMELLELCDYEGFTTQVRFKSPEDLLTD